MSNYFAKDDELITAMKTLLKEERSKYRGKKGRYRELPNGWNEVLKKDFIKALPQYDSDEIDIIIEKLQQRQVILKVEGVIIHLNPNLIEVDNGVSRFT